MFLSPFKRGFMADAGGDRSAFGSFFFEPLGMRSSSGMRVTSGSAMRLSAVYSCVRVLAESFAVLPFRLYRKRADGGRDPVVNHWLVTLMRRPNQFQTGFEWREMMMGHLALRGNAFNLMEFGPAGSILSLSPLHPDRVQVQPLTNGSYSYVVKQLDGSTQTYPRGAIWHIRGLSSDGIVGLNPMEMAAEVIGQGLAAQSFGARFFANDAKPGGWIEYDGKFAGQDEKRLFREGWQKAQGGSNRGKTAVLERGFKYHELTVNNSDAQFLELMQHTRSEIAGMFRVPPHMVGDLSRATFGNIEQQSIDFINGGILPWTERWEASIETNLLLDEDQGLEIEFDFANMLRGDMAARSAYYTANINNGSLTRNEARIMEGRNPLDGLDEPLQMLNMVPAGTPPEPPAGGDGSPPAPTKPPPNQPPGKKKAEAEDRFAALARSTAERVARKEAEMVAKAAGDRPRVLAAYGKHAPFVAQALAIDADAAAGYCAAQIALFDAEPGMEIEQFEIIACGRLEALALGGDPLQVDQGASAMHRLAHAIAAQPAPVINVAAPAIHVDAPAITNNLPQPGAINVAAPVVNITTPEPQVSINVQPAAVTVNTPEPVVNVSVAAPDVQITNKVEAAAAPNVSVNVEAPKAKQQDKPWPTLTTIKKRDAQGRADVIETRPTE